MFIRLYSEAIKAPDQGARYRAASDAIELIPRMNPWPLPRPTRESALGTMHGVRGRYWSVLHEAGDLEAGRRAVTEFETAQRYLSSGDGLNGAMIELNFAVVLSTLRIGDQTANRARAESLLLGLLNRLGPQEGIDLWVNIRLNLIAMYGEPNWLDPADRVERGIELAQAVIDQTSRRTSPVLWARGKMSLAMLLIERTRGIRPENIEQAIKHLSELKEVIPPDAEEDYAYLFELLSRAYAAQSEERDPDYLDRALRANAEAIALFERRGHDFRWAGLKAQRALMLSLYKGEQFNAARQEARRCVEQALTVYTSQSHPDAHMRAIDLLAELTEEHSDSEAGSVRGMTYQAARQRLSLEDKERDPYSWQRAQRAVAQALLRRSGRLSSAEADEAIGCLRLALSVLDPEKHLMEWTDAMNLLGDAYAEHPTGSFEYNKEQAVAIHGQLLDRIAPASHPVLWAEIARRQALNYGDRHTGIRADNLEYTIAYLELAFAAIDVEQEARLANLVLEDLGAKFSERIRGDKERNARRSLDLLSQAERGHDRERDPIGWLRVKIKLNDAQRAVASFDSEAERTHRESAETAPVRRLMEPEEYFASLEQNAQAIEPTKHFRTWALARIAFADALTWTAPPGDDEAGNLLARMLPQIDRALDVCREILDTPGVERDPFIMNFTQRRIGSISHLGAMLAEGAHEFFDMTEDEVDLHGRRRSAVAQCERALELSRPFGIRSTIPCAVLLGDAYFADAHWDQALLAYGEALDASAAIIDEPEISEDETRDTLKSLGQIASNAPWAAIRAGDPQAAIRLAAKTRSRLLTKALSRGTVPLSDDLSSELAEIRSKVIDLEQRIAPPEMMNRLPLVKELVGARSALTQLLELQRVGDQQEDISETQAWLEAMVHDYSWIALLILTTSGSKWVVVGPHVTGVRITVHDLPDEFSMSEFYNGRGTSDTDSWTATYRQLFTEKNQFASVVWRQFLRGACHRLHTRYVHALHVAADEHGIPHGGTVHIVPDSVIAMLPIAASGPEDDSFSLIDRLTLSVLPTLRRGTNTSTRRGAGWQPRAAGVVYAPPSGPNSVMLPSAQIEASLVASAFDESASEVLASDSLDIESVVRSLRGKDVWHFATHGIHDTQEPMRSGLVLSESIRLTLSDLFMRYDLGRPGLVVLSACESGLYSGEALPAELVGLPTSFLMLGAESVIAALWPVDDLATTLLMGRLYEVFPAHAPSSSTALRTAQQWLRDADSRTILDTIAQWLRSGRLNPEQHDRLARRVSKHQATDGPFASPDYWGAWVHYGSG